MSRFFAKFECNRRKAIVIVKSHRNKYYAVGRDGTDVFGLQDSRFSSYFRHCHAQHSPSFVSRNIGCISRSGFWRNYSVIYANNTMMYHAKTAWKQISQVSFSRGQTLSSISKVAQAFSLASTRSHLLVPSGLTFLLGHLALVEQAYAEFDQISPRNAVMKAENKHSYITILLSSVWEAFVLVLRALYLAIVFSPSVMMAPFSDSLGPEFRKLWLQLLHATLENAGPAFIKWGQWAATRPDLFPRDLCSELSRLQTKAPQHSFDHTKRTLEKAFGRKVTDIFESFEELPVASGSIAQVHRAYLRYQYPGQKIKPIEVAVKVRHPGVGESIRRDFVIINAVAKVSTLIPALKWLRLDESVQQFAVFMLSQVDLAREAAHLNRFIYNFRRWKHVSFPKPVYPLVHPAVLVETYEQGESVAHYVDELEGHSHIKAALADIGTNALLKMLLVDNFVHADLHPGNILVRAQTKSTCEPLVKSRPHVIFLDVGMTAELSKSDRGSLVEFFKAVARRDGHTAAECTLRLSKQQNCPNPEAFIKEVTTSFNFWGSAAGNRVHPADCMQQLLEQVRRHKVNIDGNVCTVLVTTLVLEGWQRKLDPGYDVMNTLQTLLYKADWAQSLSFTIEQLMGP